MVWVGKKNRHAGGRELAEILGCEAERDVSAPAQVTSHVTWRASLTSPARAQASNDRPCQAARRSQPNTCLNTGFTGFAAGNT